MIFLRGGGLERKGEFTTIIRSVENYGCIQKSLWTSTVKRNLFEEKKKIIVVGYERYYELLKPDETVITEFYSRRLRDLSAVTVPFT